MQPLLEDDDLKGRVVRLEAADMSDWDDFVICHPLGSLYHLSKWKTVLEESYPQMKGHCLVVMESSSDKILAGLLLFEVKSWILGNRLVSVPYANWCDPLVSNREQLILLLSEAEKLGRELSSKWIEFHPRSVGDFASMPGWSVEKNWKHHSFELTSGLNDLWKGCSRTSICNRVKKAKRAGIQVSSENSEEALVIFYDLLLETRCRLGLPPMPYRFFVTMWRKLSGEEKILLLARKGKEVFGGVLAVKGKGVFHLEYAADAESAKYQGVMQLLYWRAIEIATEEGFKEFSFGRTSPDNTGLIFYKRRWGATEESLPVYVNSYLSKTKSGGRHPMAMRFIKGIFRNVPRVLSRILGAFLYRHWG